MTFLELHTTNQLRNLRQCIGISIKVLKSTSAVEMRGLKFRHPGMKFEFETNSKVGLRQIQKV